MSPWRLSPARQRRAMPAADRENRRACAARSRAARRAAGSRRRGFSRCRCRRRRPSTGAAAPTIRALPAPIVHVRSARRPRPAAARRRNREGRRQPRPRPRSTGPIRLRIQRAARPAAGADAAAARPCRGQPIRTPRQQQCLRAHARLRHAAWRASPMSLLRSTSFQSVPGQGGSAIRTRLPSASQRSAAHRAALSPTPFRSLIGGDDDGRGERQRRQHQPLDAARAQRRPAGPAHREHRRWRWSRSPRR